MKELRIKNQTISSKKVTVCVPVVSSTDVSILNEVKNCIDKKVSLIELRMDFYEKLMDADALLVLLEKISKLCENTALLFTIRTSDEGGEAVISEEDYKKIIIAVSRSRHVDLVDCEIDKLSSPKEFFEMVHTTGTKIVASHHNFSKTYDSAKIESIYQSMYDAGADIVKLAMMPQKKSDTLRLLMAVDDFQGTHEEALMVGISMGELGKPSRAVGGFVGSCITFASIEKASAPGQIDYEGMNTVLSILNY